MADNHFHEIFVDGSWRESESAAQIAVLNPANGSVIANVAEGTAGDVDLAVAAARRAFDSWWNTHVHDRASFLSSIAEGISRRAEELAQQISQEVGCPITFAREMQVPLAINHFNHAAEVAKQFEFETVSGRSSILREPFGVVGAITPWNFPLHQVAAKVAYALAAGNTTVTKPSEVAPLSVWLLTEIIEESGLPAGVYNLVSGTGPVVGEAIALHPDVDMVSFTGSTKAGIRVSELAARTVKRVALELGGKSANVVLPDANMQKLMPHAIEWAFVNSGQTCLALSRLLVPREQLAEAEALAKEMVEATVVGDPSSPETKIGPLVSDVQLERVRKYIQSGLDEGAKLITGGLERIDGAESGYYIRPTVFSNVSQNMTIHRDEIFGPVLSIVPYDNEDEAISIANNSVYGLSGAVWSADPAKARSVAGRLRTGQVTINGGQFNPNAPFGGYKMSGNGRELGAAGLAEFLEVKSIQS